jgi:transposase
MGQAVKAWHPSGPLKHGTKGVCPMSNRNDQSKKSFTAFDQGTTLLAVVELSRNFWLVAGIVPGIERQPSKKLAADENKLLTLVRQWQQRAVKAGGEIKRIVVAFEAGRDGFWLARWLRARGIEAYVIHATSIAVSREHRRAKTDRLDTEHLKRVVLGWLRGEPDHCRMVAIPTIEEEDAKRPNRERETLVRECTRIVNRMKACLARFGVRGLNLTLRKAADQLETLVTPEGMRLPPLTLAEMLRDIARLRLLREQIRIIEKARVQRLKAAPVTRANMMVYLIARVVGIGIETADMLVHEILSRKLRDRRAVARYAGLTGSPDESGNRRREKGLARAGNARVRRGMIQLAWRFLRSHPGSALAQWYNKRAADGRGSIRKTMIVALARKLLIVLWRMVTTGEVPADIKLRPATA